VTKDKSFACAAQAALPYKSKPKTMKPRKKPTLEQRRAVVLEPGERKAVALVHQLNALRNEKAVKRREKQARQRQVGSPMLPQNRSPRGW
jgi:ribosome biogenesis protein BMS1